MFQFYWLTVFPFVLTIVQCQSSSNSNQNLWSSLVLSPDFEKGIPSNGNVESSRRDDSIDDWSEKLGFNRTTSEQSQVHGNIDSSYQIFPDPSAVRSLMSSSDDDIFQVSKSFMEGRPNSLTLSPKPQHATHNETKNSTKIQRLTRKFLGPQVHSIKFDVKDKVESKPRKVETKLITKKPLINLIKSKFDKTRETNNRRNDNSKVAFSGKKKEPVKVNTANRRNFGSTKLDSQASYMFPATQLAPLNLAPSQGQILLNIPSSASAVSFVPSSPQVQLSVPSQQTQSTSFSLSPVISTVQSSQIQLSSPTNSAVPQVSSVSSPTFQTIGQQQQQQPQQQQQITTLSSPSFTSSGQTVQSSPGVQITSGLASAQPIHSSPIIQITPQSDQSTSVQSIPTFQAVPVSIVSSQAAPTVQLSRSQQFSPQVYKTVQPTVLSSPGVSTITYASPVSLVRSGSYLRSPIGFRSSTQRAASYFSPSVPQRSRTVYTQTQMVPTHTTIYTTTHYTPATRTTVYETDHIPVYSSSIAEPVVAKAPSKYGSSVASLYKYGKSIWRLAEDRKWPRSLLKKRTKILTNERA